MNRAIPLTSSKALDSTHLFRESSTSPTRLRCLWKKVALEELRHCHWSRRL